MRLEHAACGTRNRRTLFSHRRSPRRAWAGFAWFLPVALCWSGSFHGGALAAEPPTPGVLSKPDTLVGALIARAAREGELNIAWSPTFADNGKAITAWGEAFNRFYNLRLKFSATPPPTMAAMAGKIAQESAAGVPASSDVFLGGAVHIASLIEKKALQPFEWSAMAHELGVEIPPEAIAPENLGLAFATEIYGITYSTSRIKADEVPQTLAAVLDPKWKDRIASTANAAGFFQLAVFSKLWGPEKATQYVEALSRHIAGLVRGGDKTTLLTGQFDMIVLDTDISSAIMAKRLGEPVGFVIPADAPVIDFWNMAVPRTSRHPAAAALLILFMLTPEGQKLSWDSDGKDLHLLPTSQVRQLLPNRPTIGGRVADFLNNPEILAYHEKFGQIISRKK